VASLSQGRTAAAQCGLFTYKSVPVIFEPPCISISDSSYLNPLTIDVRDGRIPRTCVDAGKINKCTMPD